MLKSITKPLLIVCVHSDPHPSGPIIGLAICLGLFFAITVAMATVLLVLCMISFKKRRSEKGIRTYIDINIIYCMYIRLRNVYCSLLHFGPLQNPTMLTQTMMFP